MRASRRGCATGGRSDGWRSSRSPRSFRSSRSCGRAAAPVPKTILVEAEVGQSGMGVFLVENTTAEQLSIPVSASPFHDPRGREVHPAIAFRPEVITLEPGDQQVVQVAAAVDETLEPDVRYHALISVPGLSATRIPIVLRRRPGAVPGPKRKRQAKAATPSS